MPATLLIGLLFPLAAVALFAIRRLRPGILLAILAFAMPARAEGPGIPPPDLERGENPVERPPVCAPDWASRVYSDTRPSVVRIDVYNGNATGFVVFTSKYVATNFHVIQLGRPVTVSTADGSKQEARVVAVDKAHDLAILELEHPVAAPPLATATEPAPVGTPVLAIGHPLAGPDPNKPDCLPFAEGCKRLRGLLFWTATQGIISTRNDELIQVDAAVNPGNSGGPLLACDGRVLGVVSNKIPEGEGLGFAVPMVWVDALRSSIGRQPVYAGHWLSEFTIGVPIQVDRSYTWVGGQIGVGAVAHDRWTTEARIGLLGATSTPGTSPISTAAGHSGPVVSSGGLRFLAEVDETYRAVLFGHHVPTYVLGGFGGAVTYDRLSQTTFGLTPVTPGCTAASGVACQSITSTNTHQTSARVWPMAIAGLASGPLVVTYAFQLNVDTVADSTHRMIVAYRF